METNEGLIPPPMLFFRQSNVRNWLCSITPVSRRRGTVWLITVVKLATRTDKAPTLAGKRL